MYATPEPCPFCDSPHVKLMSDANIHAIAFFWTQCEGCAARGPHRGSATMALGLWNEAAKLIAKANAAAL